MCSLLYTALLGKDVNGEELEAELTQVLSIAASDAQLLYAAPSHWCGVHY
jgi:hypothetical protein